MTKPADVQAAIARVRHKVAFTHYVNPQDAKDALLVCDAAEKVVRANDCISSAPPAPHPSEPPAGRWYPKPQAEQMGTPANQSAPIEPTGTPAPCPLPANLEEAIQNALVTLDECDVPAAEWLRKEINIACEQQLAADGIVEECAQAAIHEAFSGIVVNKQLRSALQRHLLRCVRALKGKFLLSAPQTSEPTRAEIEAEMCQPFCEKHSPRGITCACDVEAPARMRRL